MTDPLVYLLLDAVASGVDPFVETVEAFQDRVDVKGHGENVEKGLDEIETWRETVYGVRQE